MFERISFRSVTVYFRGEEEEGCEFCCDVSVVEEEFEDVYKNGFVSEDILA